MQKPAHETDSKMQVYHVDKIIRIDDSHMEHPHVVNYNEMDANKQYAALSEHDDRWSMA